jgi:hypothetical protein
VEVTCHEEDSVEAEEAELVGEDPCTTMREVRSRSLSMSRYPIPGEELAKSWDTRCHHRHLPRTWPM